MTDREFSAPNPDGYEPEPGEKRLTRSQRIRDEFKAGYSIEDLAFRWDAGEMAIEATIRQGL